MPLVKTKADSTTHRPKTQASWSPFPVAVTKMISKKEMREIPEALEAMRKEFARLSGKCWIEKDRRSKKEVIAEAQKNGEEVHFSMVHGIIGEKGYELPKGDPRRKYKGRAVVLGDRVFDQDYETATFADMGSAPTTLEGGRLVDAYGCAPGNASETSDAIQAFCQAPMLSKVWVTLPSEAVFDPDFYYSVRDPVVLLILALYGYPDSPTFWEVYCDTQVVKTGWEKIGPEWPSMFWHPRLKLLLSIYVDDFKMAGPKENLAEGWALLRQGIDMEDPATPTLYLGCEQSMHELTLPSGSKVKAMVYDMENFLGTCVSKYLQCTGAKEIKESCLPYLPKEEPHSIFNTATQGGFLPESRSLPPDYNEWLKANGLDPVDVELDEDYDDQ